MSEQTKECIEIHSLEELKKLIMEKQLKNFNKVKLLKIMFLYLWKRMTMRYLP